jgi:hypothetical protein
MFPSSRSFHTTALSTSLTACLSSVFSLALARLLPHSTRRHRPAVFPEHFPDILSGAAGGYPWRMREESYLYVGNVTVAYIYAGLPGVAHGGVRLPRQDPSRVAVAAVRARPGARIPRRTGRSSPRCGRRVYDVNVAETGRSDSCVPGVIVHSLRCVPAATIEVMAVWAPSRRLICVSVLRPGQAWISTPIWTRCAAGMPVGLACPDHHLP